MNKVRLLLILFCGAALIECSQTSVGALTKRMYLSGFLFFQVDLVRYASARQYIFSCMMWNDAVHSRKHLRII